jgi:hypothetical protein
MTETESSGGGSNSAQRSAPVQKRKLRLVWHLCGSFVWFETSSATDVFPRWGDAEDARSRRLGTSVEVAESRGGVPD